MLYFPKYTYNFFHHLNFQYLEVLPLDILAELMFLSYELFDLFSQLIIMVFNNVMFLIYLLRFF